MDIRKLQRAIVDGLEDVKAHDIAVFNTEHLSPLFERVIIASGTSNRQTKALAASVRDRCKSRGLQVMRTEGEDNGEWIIVDCGAAVVHIMQPAIRDYYHLEEIWGDKPVKMKIGDGAGQRAGRRLRRKMPRRRRAAASRRASLAPAKKAAGQGCAAKKRADRRGARPRRAIAAKPGACAQAGGGQAGRAQEPRHARRPRRRRRARAARMKLLVVAVGQRQPAWAEAAWADFAKRFPPEMRLELKALKAEPRSRGKTAAAVHGRRGAAPRGGAARRARAASCSTNAARGCTTRAAGRAAAASGAATGRDVALPDRRPRRPGRGAEGAAPTKRCACRT